MHRRASASDLVEYVEVVRQIKLRACDCSFVHCGLQLKVCAQIAQLAIHRPIASTRSPATLVNVYQVQYESNLTTMLKIIIKFTSYRIMRFKTASICSLAFQRFFKKMYATLNHVFRLRRCFRISKFATWSRLHHIYNVSSAAHRFALLIGLVRQNFVRIRA